MSRTVKWIIGVFGALIGLVVIASLLLPLFINPNDYRDTIAEKIRARTGRNVSIPGDIGLDVSLAGLKTVFSLGEISLSAGKGFADAQFISSRQAEIELALWPLLTKKELQVTRVSLEGVNVHLVKNRDGRGNWDSPVGSGKKSGRPAGQDEKPQPKSKESPNRRLASIDIGGVRARDINITFVDNQAGRTVKLSNFDLDVGHILDGKPFPIKANFDLFHEDRQKKSVSMTVKAESSFIFFPARQHFIVEGLDLKGVVRGIPTLKQELDIAVSADIDLKLREQKVEIKKLAVRQGKMQVNAVLAVAGFTDPQFTGSLRIPAFSPRAQAENLGFTLRLKDPAGLSRVEGEIDFSGTGNELQAKKLALQVDETTINGTAAIHDFADPAYDLVLDIDQLDLDKYAKITLDTDPDRQKKTPARQDSPKAAGKTAPAGKSSPAGKQDGDRPVIPADLLRNLAFNARITIGRLKASGMNITDIRLNASGNDGLVSLDPFAADLYKGTIRATADIDTRRDIPVLHLTKDLQGVEAGPLFRDMTGKEEIKGRLDVHVALTTRGLTQKELTRNAYGKVRLSLADGAIAKLQIIDTIRTAKMLLSGTGGQPGGAPAANTGAGRPTEFADLKATGVITNGVLENNDLVAESELMKVKGRGTVNLVTRRIDYLLTIYLAKYLERDRESGLVELTDTPIPYRIRGTFDKIDQSAALEELAIDQGKKLLIKELEKQLGGDKAKDGSKKESSDFTGELINQGLKSLFGN